MKKGFTLVELAIVLVIIGLLIGGILVAQSMIGTSKIVAQAAQIGQFDAGVESFKAKYNYLPGDAPAFGGDGDGIIEQSGNAVASFGCEIGNFWSNIDQSLYPGSSACVAPGLKPQISGASKNVPAAKLGIANAFFIAATGTGADQGFADTANIKNYYALLNPNEAQATQFGTWYFFSPTTATNSAVKPTELLALDAKADDGIANSGNILSGAIGAWTGGTTIGGIITMPATGTCSSGPTYTVSHTGYECTPIIRMGSQAGDPQ